MSERTHLLKALPGCPVRMLILFRGGGLSASHDRALRTSILSAMLISDTSPCTTLPYTHDQPGRCTPIDLTREEKSQYTLPVQFCPIPTLSSHSLTVVLCLMPSGHRSKRSQPRVAGIIVPKQLTGARGNHLRFTRTRDKAARKR